MFRSVTSDVSAVPSCVAKGHQTLHHVSSSPSKIPRRHNDLYVAKVRVSEGSILPIVGTLRRPSGTSLVLPETTQSRGPWLARGFCCPSGSMLTMASSETLGPSRRLICFVQADLCPTALYGLGPSGSPICAACLSLRAAVRTPVDPMAACGRCFAIGASLRLIRTGSASTMPPSPVPRGTA
jgi:hypothetical protein